MDSTKLLSHYQRAINKIDDYFEYRCESEKDKQYVYKVLAELTEDITKEVGQ